MSTRLTFLFFILFAGMLAAADAGAAGTAAATPLVGPSSIVLQAQGVKLPASMPEEILRYVNAYRRQKHLSVLKADSYISSVALGHSRDMLSGKTAFGHDGFKDRIARIRQRLGPLHVAAENVASGPMSAREVVDGWLHSPGHRRNIEGDFRLTGIGLAHARNGMIYFTQIFVR